MMNPSRDQVWEELPPFILDDYIVRIEWQKRGMPHAHLLGYCKRVQRNLRARAASDKPPPQPRSFGPDEAESAADDASPTNIPEVIDAYIQTTAPKRWRDVCHNPQGAGCSEDRT